MIWTFLARLYVTICLVLVVWQAYTAVDLATLVICAIGIPLILLLLCLVLIVRKPRQSRTRPSR